MADPQIQGEFPEDFFPPILEEFKNTAARSIGMSAEYMVPPMLAAASVAIGTAATAVVKANFHQPASLFVLTVGYKASCKTPAFKLGLWPVEDEQRQREQRAAHFEQLLAEGEEQDEEEVEFELACCCASDGCETDEEDVDDDCDDGDCDDEEEEDDDDMPCCGNGKIVMASPHMVSQGFDLPPVPLRQLVLNDTTLPALWQALEHSQRGVLLFSDELSSIFLPSSAAHRQVLCDLYEANSRTVHRKTNRHGPIILKRTFVTLAGGIQTDLFPSIRGKYDGGLLERFLICGKPETSLPPWSDEVVDPAAEMAWNLAIKALLKIEAADYAGSADRKGLVPFTRAAYNRLRILYESLAAYVRSRGIHLKHQGIVRKLVANAARLALIRRCLRWAVGEFGFFGPVGMVEEDDCDVACRAAEFFLTRYLNWMPQIVPASPEPQSLVTPQQMTLTDRILAYLTSKGKTSIEVRKLRQQTMEGNPSTEAIRAALDEAVARGRGRWADTEKKTFICG